MSESGGRDPIIIPIGFVIDETSLEAAIREAKRRFAEALSVPEGAFPSSYGAQPSQYGDAQVAAEREIEDRAAGIWRDEYRGINTQVEEFGRKWEKSFTDIEQRAVAVEAYWGSISGLIERATTTTTTAIEQIQEPTKDEPSEFVSAILHRADKAGESDILIPDRLIEKDTTDEILEAADKSMFDDAQRTAFMEEVWKYLKNWITNMPGPGGGFRVTQEPLFERITTEGTEKELFEDVALIAGREEAREFFDSITDRLKDEELRWAIYDDLMKNLVMVTGGITEAGGLGVQVMLNADEMSEGSIEAANRTALMLQERITQGLLSSPELFTELATILQDKVVDAFTQKGERVDAMTTAVVEVTPTFMAREAPGEGIPNIPNLLTVTNDVLTKLESRLEGWKPKISETPTPIPEEFATLANYIDWIKYERKISEEREKVEKFGSRTKVMEGAMQKATSLAVKPGETRERREAPEDFVSSELYPMSIVEEMVQSREGLEEVTAMFGRQFATERAAAIHRYETDATRLFGQIRRRYITPVAEAGEPDLLLREDEKIRPPEEEGVRFGALAMAETPELYPRGDTAVDIGSLFNEREKTMDIDQIQRWREDREAQQRLEDEIWEEDRRERMEKWDSIKFLFEEEEETEQWEKVFGPQNILEELLKQEEETNREAERINTMRTMLVSSISKLEDVLGIGVGDGEQFQAYDKRGKTKPGLSLTNDDLDAIADRVEEKTRGLWQKTLPGRFAPTAEVGPDKIRRKRSKTSMSRQLSEWEDVTGEAVVE